MDAKQSRLYVGVMAKASAERDSNAKLLGVALEVIIHETPQHLLTTFCFFQGCAFSIGQPSSAWGTV